MIRDFACVVEQCLSARQLLAEPRGAKRLFHGRGQRYPGFEDLTVDWFAGCLVVGCFSDDLAGATELAAELAQVVEGVNGVVVQLRQRRQTPGETVFGAVPDELNVLEAGLSYRVRPTSNQNVGLFLDMAPTRAWIRDRANGCNVLNLFAYTCGFSVAAVAGGANSVVNVDMSRTALSWGQRNHAGNDHDARKIRMLPHDLFKSWSKVRQLGRYELVIIDPPTSQHGSFVAEKHYPTVLKRLPELCAPGADVVACLNSPFLDADFLPQLMERHCPTCHFVDFLPVSADFPDRFPDRGLKISHFRFAKN